MSTEEDCAASDLQALRVTAEAATPGPWETLGGYVEGVYGGEVTPQSVNCMSYCYGGSVERMSDADATHIATFDPPTILALLSRLEAAEKVIEDAQAFCREQRDSIRGQFDQTGGAPAEYIGFANACGDVVGILSAYTKGTDRD